MPKIKAQITVSLDGYMAGPNQTQKEPLGEGGEDLHQWAFNLKAFRGAHDREGGEGDENPSNTVLAAAQENIGGVVMGRNMFGPIRGDWPDEDWKGWWGEDPPYHCPVYVLTHHPREPFELEGGNSFHFVTEGVEKAMAEAKEAADDQDVAVAGGASTLQQAIGAGLLDEIVVTQTSRVLGGGERLFDHLAAGTKVELTDVVRGREAVHLTYRFG